MTTALTPYNFHGDDLDVVERDGSVYVATRSVCSALKINDATQRRKLKGKAWATEVMMTSVGADGKSREMHCLHIDSLPMWLATIEPSKVSESVRGKLVRYQLECARVLREHFVGGTRPEPALSPLASAPIQARIGDDIRARACLQSLCSDASKVSGRTVQSIHGELRKPWGVASVYRIALSSYGHTVAKLQEIIDGALNVRRLPVAQAPA